MTLEYSTHHGARSSLLVTFCPGRCPHLSNIRKSNIHSCSLHSSCTANSTRKSECSGGSRYCSTLLGTQTNNRSSHLFAFAHCSKCCPGHTCSWSSNMWRVNNFHYCRSDGPRIDHLEETHLPLRFGYLWKVVLQSYLNLFGTTLCLKLSLHSDKLAESTYPTLDSFQS